MTHTYLKNDMVITKAIAQVIVGEVTTLNLYREGILPTTLGELKDFSGEYIDGLLYVLEGAVYLDGDCEDWAFVDINDDAYSNLRDKGYRHTVAKAVPSELRVTHEAEYIKIDVKRPNCDFTYYWDYQDRLLKSVSTILNKDITSTRVYQYGVRNELIGWVGRSSNKDHVSYHHRHPRFEDAACEQRIFSSAWDRAFPEIRHDITAQEVEAKLTWPDYRNRENIRVAHGLEGEHLVTHHRAMLQESELNGHIMTSYVYRNGKLTNMFSNRYHAALLCPRTREEVRPAIVPTTKCFAWDNEGLINRIAYGGGHFADFVRTRVDGKTKFLRTERYSLHMDERCEENINILIQCDK